MSYDIEFIHKVQQNCLSDHLICRQFHYFEVVTTNRTFALFRSRALSKSNYLVHYRNFNETIIIFWWSSGNLVISIQNKPKQAIFAVFPVEYIYICRNSSSFHRYLFVKCYHLHCSCGQKRMVWIYYQIWWRRRRTKKRKNKAKTKTNEHKK